MDHFGDGEFVHDLWVFIQRNKNRVINFKFMKKNKLSNPKIDSPKIGGVIKPQQKMAFQIQSVSLSDMRIATTMKSIAPCWYDEVNQIVLNINLPNASLDGLCAVNIASEEDLLKIPNADGNYWILTDEPLAHCLHSGKTSPQPLPCGLRVVYNGVSDKLHHRAKEHLWRSNLKGGFGTQSGISVDLLMEEPFSTSQIKSHVKCMWGEKKKIPKIWWEGSYQKPMSKTQMINTLFLSDEEKTFAIHQPTTNYLYFKNGIHVLDPKHKPYRWVFVFVPIALHHLRNYVENEWRQRHGVPILCSYNAGR